jgi:ABC-type multidrug transport system ATPase subunit
MCCVPVYNIILLARLPHDTPTDAMDWMVKKTLRSLGLTDVRKNLIGTHFQRGISGGQKRRVTIASSVVTQPQILLCDEPTSGLDSTTSYQVTSASEPSHRIFECPSRPNLQVMQLND